MADEELQTELPSESSSYQTIHSDSGSDSGSLMSILKIVPLGTNAPQLQKQAKGHKGTRMQKRIKHNRRGLAIPNKLIFPMHPGGKMLKSNLSVGTDTASDMEELKKFRTRDWIEQNLRKVEDYKEDEEMMGLRMQELLEIPQDEYLNVLYEIRNQRDQQRRRRNAKRIEKAKQVPKTDADMKKELHLEKLRLKRMFSPKQMKKVNFLRRCWMRCQWGLIRLSLCYRESSFHEALELAGFYSPDFAIICHNGACVLVLTWAILIMVLVGPEMQELRVVFRGVDSVVTNRTVSLWSAVFILAAGIFGLAGTSFQRGGLIYVYVICFLLGWGIYLSNEVHERSFAKGNALEEFINSEVQHYVKGDGKGRDFLTAIQTEFKCCGSHGPIDYGYTGKLTGGQKFVLPNSCCYIESYAYIHQAFTECFISPDLSPNLQIFVNFEGCTAPIKFYLQQLFKVKERLDIFMVSVTIAFVLSFLNLSYHFFSTTKQRKKPPQRKFTPGEMLMEAIEDSLLESNEFDFEKIPGSIDEIRKRLAECETVTDFVTVIMDMIKEVDFVIYADPEALARAILGLTPRDVLLPHADLQDRNQLQTRVKGEKELRRLAKDDFKFRYMMQNQPKTVTQQIELSKQHAEMFPKLRFPLPGPPDSSRVRETTYEWDGMLGRLQRQDKILSVDKEHRPPMLADGRVIQAPAPVGNPSLWNRLLQKTSPEDYYVDMENAQFSPEVDVLTRIIAESQAMLRDLHRKTGFVGQFTGNPLVDASKVTEAVKLLLNTEAMKEFKPPGPINRLEFKRAMASSLRDPIKSYHGIRSHSSSYVPVADHRLRAERVEVSRPHQVYPDRTEKYVTIGVQTSEASDSSVSWNSKKRD